MSDDKTQEGELEVKLPGGAGARAKGYRLVDLIWLPMVLGIGYISLTLYNHGVDAKDGATEIAKALEKSNLKVADALEKSNAKVVEALDRQSNEQRRATEAIKEGNCLNSLPQDRRINAAEICKRTARDYR